MDLHEPFPIQLDCSVTPTPLHMTSSSFNLTFESCRCLATLILIVFDTQLRQWRSLCDPNTVILRMSDPPNVMKILPLTSNKTLDIETIFQIGSCLPSHESTNSWNESKIGRKWLTREERQSVDAKIRSSMFLGDVQRCGECSECLGGCRFINSEQRRSMPIQPLTRNFTD